MSSLVFFILYVIAGPDLSGRREKLSALVENLREFDRNESGFAHEQMMMRPDFPQPDLYKKVFESWGMDHE